MNDGYGIIKFRTYTVHTINSQIDYDKFETKIHTDDGGKKQKIL